MRDYRSKSVNGFITDGEHMARVKIRVQMTSDEKGKTLSLGVEDDNIPMQLSIPLEAVRDIIRVYNDRGGKGGAR